MTRGRPRRRWLPGVDLVGRRRWTALAALAVVMLVAGALVTVATHRHRPIDPAREAADARTAMRIGNYSAARRHAQAAIAASPGSTAAQLLLARAYLQLGDGLAADATLARARDAGMPAAMLHGYLARARFLQGDIDGSLEEAAKAPPGDAFAIRARALALAARGDGAQASALLSALLARVPADGEAWTDLGRVRLVAGEIAAAAQATGQALHLRPQDPTTLTLEGEIVRERYGLAAALPWFEAALRHDAYYHPALIEEAATLGELGRNAEMLAATRKALAARPGSAQALYLQAVLAVRAGKIELARSLLDRTGSALDALPGALLLDGGIAATGGKGEAAIRNWRMLSDLQPTNLVVRRLLGAALLRSGDAQGALDALKPVALRGDADSYTLTLVARAFEATGDRTAAARFLDRAAAPQRGAAMPFATDQGLSALQADAAQAPADPNHALDLIRGLIGGGSGAAALDRARALVSTAPGVPAAQLALGDTLAASGRYAEAAEAYTQAADLTFDEPTMLRLVDALGRAGKPREAAATLALYLDQNPQSVIGRRLLGHLQVANGENAAAVETLERVRRVVGNRDALLLADLAFAYAATGDGAIAHRYGRAAYALMPMSAVVADAFGIALAADDDAAGARQLLVKAARLDPGSATIAAHLRQIER